MYPVVRWVADEHPRYRLTPCTYVLVHACQVTWLASQSSTPNLPRLPTSPVLHLASQCSGGFMIYSWLSPFVQDGEKVW